MAIRPILKMGDPLLLQVSEPVEDIHDPQLEELIRDMFDTMEQASGAGLAAPQIGVLKRIIIFGVRRNPRYPDAEEVPTTVLINPIVQPIGRRMEEDWEGCLSVPGMAGLVPRYSRVRYSGYTREGERIEREVEGFHARVVQHECDHIDGILYPRRIRDLRNFGFEEAFVAKQGQQDD